MHDTLHETWHTLKDGMTNATVLGLRKGERERACMCVRKKKQTRKQQEWESRQGNARGGETSLADCLLSSSALFWFSTWHMEPRKRKESRKR